MTDLNARFDPSRTSVGWQLITPDVAAEFLTHNTSNRRVKAGGLRKITSDLRAGRWVPNGNSISFASDGSMVDGQHRCLAIVETGVSVWSLVVRGLPKASQDTTDGGTARSASDQLERRDIPNAANTAAAVRMRHQVEAWIGGQMSTVVLSNADVVAEVDRRGEQVRHLVLVGQRAGSSRPARIPPSVPGGLSLYLVDHGVPIADVEAFWEQFRRFNLGEELPTETSDPVWRLRETLMPDGLSTRPAQVCMALAIKAWNARAVGATVKNLMWRKRSETSPEKFPTPITVLA